MDTWYYSEDNAQKGPVTLNQLKAMFQTGKLNRSTLIYGPNMKDWAKASQIPGLIPQNQEQLQDSFSKTNLPKNTTENSEADNFHKSGLALAKKGEYEKAIIEYTKSIRIKKNDPVIYKNRGGAHLALENYDSAINDYNKSINLNPEYVTAYINRGFLHLTLKNYEEAIADCDKAIDLNPEKPEAYFNRANAHEGLNEIEEAISDYNEAIELKPEFDDAIKCRDKLISKRAIKPKSKSKSVSVANEQDFYPSRGSDMSNSDNKYPMLEFLSILYTFFGYLILVISTISSITILVFQTEGQKFITSMIILFFGIISFITITAGGQLIKLLIDIEFNLRRLRGRQK